jgi:hypothetical protein
MNIRQSFHLYKILEDFAKMRISFEYSPKYILPKTYYLSYKDVKNILKDNTKLIQALYKRDEKIIQSILNQSEININEFEMAQIDDDLLDDKENSNRTPLPIQARFVLTAWNMLRINALIKEKDKMLLTLNKKAFKGSFFPQITKMALAFENTSFKNMALETLNISNINQELYLFYSILAYYFRINGLQKQKEICSILSKQYLNKVKIEEEVANLAIARQLESAPINKKSKNSNIEEQVNLSFLKKQLDKIVIDEKLVELIREDLT